MATAAPSHVPSACTAMVPATTSVASANASLDSPEPSATKVVSPGESVGQGGEASWEGRGWKEEVGASHHTLEAALQGLGLPL